MVRKQWDGSKALKKSVLKIFGNKAKAFKPFKRHITVLDSSVSSAGRRRSSNMVPYERNAAGAELKDEPRLGKLLIPEKMNE